MFRLSPLTPLVRGFLIALVALFVAGAVLHNFVGLGVVQLLVLDPTSLSWLTPLQVFTHVWVLPPSSSGAISLLIGCFFLWWIVVPFQERYGSQRVWEAVLISSVAESLPTLLVGLMLPNYAAIASGPGCITLFVVCAHVARAPLHDRIAVFGLPPMTVQQLLLGMIGISAIFSIAGRDIAGLAGMLGTIGAGILYGKRWLLRSSAAPKAKRRGGPKLRIVGSRDDDDDDSGPQRWLN